MTDFTPGPWSWTDGNTTGFKTDSGGESILAQARPSDDFFVLKIAEMDSNVPPHERAANARLIAAAPCLLEQHECEVSDLKFLLRAIEEGDPKAELVLRVKDMIRRETEVISKATATRNSGDEG
jgi:hypothetical protein